MDTRIEDRRRAFERTAREQHPEMPDDWIKARVDLQVAASIASPQTGSQVNMDRPRGFTLAEYREFSDALDKEFTAEEQATMTFEFDLKDGDPEMVKRYDALVARWQKEHPG